jgi:cytochrome c-type biogenesis protein CcmH
MTRVLSSRVAWALLGVVAVVALAVGSVHGGPAAAARVAHLESIVKCPACEDLSVAQSDAPSAMALRHRISEFVAAGWSDSRIESWVTDRYGSNALLIPQSSGANAALYAIPLAVLAFGGIGLGVYFWRRRPGASAASAASAAPRASAAP